MEEGSKKLAGAFMAGGGGATGKTEEESVVTASPEEEKKEAAEEKDEESEVWIPPLPQEMKRLIVRTRVDLEIFLAICEGGSVAFDGGGGVAENSFLLVLLSNVLLHILLALSN